MVSAIAKDGSDKVLEHEAARANQPWGEMAQAGLFKVSNYYNTSNKSRRPRLLSRAGKFDYRLEVPLRATVQGFASHTALGAGN